VLRGEIENKIQLEKRIKNKQTTINKMRIKSDIKIKLNDEGRNWRKQSIEYNKKQIKIKRMRIKLKTKYKLNIPL